MTVLVRLPRAGTSAAAGSGWDADPLPPIRFAEPSTDPDDPDLCTVVRRIRGAKRVVVVCGAGVSTAAQIPDFRSAHGLFARGARNVKDLFHVKSLTSPALLPDHHALLSTLSRLAGEAQPTAFHAFMRDIDREGRLLRVYTQNIDGLEERAGLKTGIPPPPRSRRRTADASRSSSQPHSQRPSRSHSQSLQPSQPASAAQSPSASASGASSPATRESSPVRCIPLHGLLSSLHCTQCAASVPSAAHALHGAPIPCPRCDEMATIRSALSERQRRVGTLRASVVLYGEEHPQGEAIGSVMERDLRGTGPRGEREGRADLLVVAGTSLSIPGVKRIVKEMAKSLASRPEASVRDGREPPVRVVYVNAEPPAKPAEWDGVFDVWVHGDVQDFAALVADASFAPPLPKTPRRKKASGLSTPNTASTTRKRKADDSDVTPTKKRPTFPPTPASTPRIESSSSSLPPASPSLPPSPPPKPEFLRVAKRKCAQGDPKKRAKPNMSAGTKPAAPSPSPSPSPSPPPPLSLYDKCRAVARFSPPPPYDDMAGLYGRRGGAESCAVPR
ncbi:DHS-like NAD/FAD-binding domain-containing protein [Cutaneotrichosporon oleaginosum]|uniref:DHS-like NAD/FAD-binding domain-containing protein n=1 Tax=Cutaneotrichosporon oleaginosum TaxID=879819 RepID=A0A0J1B1L4_9TREE|nr:DHS-like NAD/FAD-binding domain-containing protein [Cutaneotrichosporon oleaginosum]KLT41504.1 DHS-like NAD/FAD-binding domain-containing protein [Cutaneotrichosporon oleaginosum]TXT05847.1 hypothetical protein COLE_07167 [Cutaneotrichosporon oleaginosum]